MFERCRLLTCRQSVSNGSAKRLFSCRLCRTRPAANALAKLRVLASATWLQALTSDWLLA